MTRHFDQFSISLAESCSRRESLRAAGALLAGVVLSRLPLSSAWASATDPCKTFCKCRNKTQQNQCLSACRACSGAANRLCGSCGSYVCCRRPDSNEYGACVNGRCEYWCADGAAYCNGMCTYLGNDPSNCGACGNVCPAEAPFCSFGQCWNDNCGGANLNWDSNNCGFCGNVCQWGTACVWGWCEGGGGGDGF
jgi:hypothetical protein